MVLSGLFKVEEVLKTTSAVWFKQLKEGDVFELRYNLNGRYKGAPSIDIFQDGKKVHSNNASQLKDNLEKFKVTTL